MSSKSYDPKWAGKKARETKKTHQDISRSQIFYIALNKQYCLEISICSSTRFVAFMLLLEYLYEIENFWVEQLSLHCKDAYM